MFIKSAVVAMATMFAWNCSEDTVSQPAPSNQALEYTVTAEVWWLSTPEVNILIYKPNASGVQVVTDSWNNVVGTYDSSTGTVTALDGSVIVTGVDTSTLLRITPERTIIGLNGMITDFNNNVLYDPATDPNKLGQSSNSTPAETPASSSSVASTPAVTTTSSSAKTVTSSTTTVEAKSSSSKAESSSAKEEGGKIGDVTYKGSLEQDVANGGTIETIVFSNVQSNPDDSRNWKLYFLDMKYDASAKTYTVSGTINSDHKDKSMSETLKMNGNDVTITLNIGSAAKGDITSKPKSSSAKSEETAASSTSVQAEELKYVNGGASGEGWATRYWDCCKPSCAWNENSGGNPTKTCTLQGNTVGPGDQSVCSGGQAAVCTSQIPFAVNDNLAYGFAAVPAADGGKCGKCFALEFTGEGKYETKSPHQALKGKILVVMVSNIGGDVNHGQFDVMIPGGGVGAFNGCSSVWGNNLGAQYGGLLSDCEESVGYNGDLTKKRRECLTEKCNSVFANHKDAKEGCLFLANWMQAAGNPKHKYREVECPSALKAKW